MAKEYNKVAPKEKIEIDIETTEVGEKPKMKAIVKTKPVKYKKGLMERLVVGLFGPDGVRAIGHKLNQDIVVPAIKNIVVDSITSGINMAIYGRGDQQQRPSQPIQRNYNRYGGGYSPGPRTNYQTAYQTIPEPSAPPVAGRMNGRGNIVGEYILGSRQEAVDILDALRENIEDYGYATVADYYDLLGQVTEYTDNQWGWVNLNRTQIAAVRGGYLLTLPPVEVIG